MPSCRDMHPAAAPAGHDAGAEEEGLGSDGSSDEWEEEVEAFSGSDEEREEEPPAAIQQQAAQAAPLEGAAAVAAESAAAAAAVAGARADLRGRLRLAFWQGQLMALQRSLDHEGWRRMVHGLLGFGVKPRDGAPTAARRALVERLARAAAEQALLLESADGRAVSCAQVCCWQPLQPGG